MSPEERRRFWRDGRASMQARLDQLESELVDFELKTGDNLPEGISVPEDIDEDPSATFGIIAFISANGLDAALERWPRDWVQIGVKSLASYFQLLMAAREFEKREDEVD